MSQIKCRPKSIAKLLSLSNGISNITRSEKHVQCEISRPDGNITFLIEMLASREKKFQVGFFKPDSNTANSFQWRPPDYEGRLNAGQLRRLLARITPPAAKQPEPHLLLENL